MAVLILLLMVFTSLLALGLRACDTNQGSTAALPKSNAEYSRSSITQKVVEEKESTEFVTVPTLAFWDQVIRDYHADIQKRIDFQETKNAFLSWLSKTNPQEEIFNQFVVAGYLVLCEESEADITTAYLTEIKEEILQPDLFKDNLETVREEKINKKYYKYVSVVLDG